MTAGVKIRPGELTLRVVADEAGRTRTALVRQRYPQRMTAPLHCDEHYPDAAVVCVQSPSGGAFSDDELTTDVTAEAGTHLRLTTQAATQVFAGTGPGAHHRLTFAVQAGATLEYLPKTAIPHADSRYTQVLDIEVAASGCYLGWEAVAAGRLGHGERFRYRSFDSALTVTVAGHTAVRDRQLLEPPAAARVLAADYLATLLVVAPGAECAALLADIRRVVAHLRADIRAAAAALPSSTGILVRLTTDHAPDLQHAQQRLLDTARAHLLPLDERNPSL